MVFAFNLAKSWARFKRLCNIRPEITQRRSIEKVPFDIWLTLFLLIFHRLDLASFVSGLFWSSHYVTILRPSAERNLISF